MKLWLGLLLSLLVLLVFSSQIEAGSPSGHGYGRKGERSFQGKDINKDGVISKEEWLQHYSEKFKERDTDGDGLLSQEEMRGHYKAKWKGHKKHGGMVVDEPSKQE